jgi:glutathione peroxidase-family protein
MKRLSSRCALAFLASLTAGAQGVYRNANSPTDTVCPLIQQDKTALHYGAGAPSQSPQNKDSRGNVLVEGPAGQAKSGGLGGVVGAEESVFRSFAPGATYIPQGQRRSVADFTAFDAKSLATTVASQKGKIVLVGLWSTHCDPSAKMLVELATLYPKAEQFKFQILAVNFDQNQQQDDTGEGAVEGGWRAINKFVIRNRQFFDASRMPVYTPGLGKQGSSNFMDIVESLPALFVIDRSGNLAQVHIGYKDGYVGEALKRAIQERPLPPAAPAADPAKPAQP